MALWGGGWLVTPPACAKDASLPPVITDRGLELFTLLSLLIGFNFLRKSGPAFLIVSLSLFRKSCSVSLSCSIF